MYQIKYFMKNICHKFIFDESNLYNISLNILSWRKNGKCFDSSLVTVPTEIIVLGNILDIDH